MIPFKNFIKSGMNEEFLAESSQAIATIDVTGHQKGVRNTKPYTEDHIVSHIEDKYSDIKGLFDNEQLSHKDNGGKAINGFDIENAIHKHIEANGGSSLSDSDINSYRALIRTYAHAKNLANGHTSFHDILPSRNLMRSSGTVYQKSEASFKEAKRLHKLGQDSDEYRSKLLTSTNGNKNLDAHIVEYSGEFHDMLKRHQHALYGEIAPGLVFARTEEERKSGDTNPRVYKETPKKYDLASEKSLSTSTNDTVGGDAYHVLKALGTMDFLHSDASEFKDADGNRLYTTQNQIDNFNKRRSDLISTDKHDKNKAGGYSPSATSAIIAHEYGNGSGHSKKGFDIQHPLHNVIHAVDSTIASFKSKDPKNAHAIDNKTAINGRVADQHINGFVQRHIDEIRKNVKDGDYETAIRNQLNKAMSEMKQKHEGNDAVHAGIDNLSHITHGDTYGQREDLSKPILRVTGETEKKDSGLPKFAWQTAQGVFTDTGREKYGRAISKSEAERTITRLNTTESSLAHRLLRDGKHLYYNLTDNENLDYNNTKLNELFNKSDITLDTKKMMISGAQHLLDSLGRNSFISDDLRTKFHNHVINPIVAMPLLRGDHPTSNLPYKGLPEIDEKELKKKSVQSARSKMAKAGQTTNLSWIMDKAKTAEGMQHLKDLGLIMEQTDSSGRNLFEEGNARGRTEAINKMYEAGKRAGYIIENDVLDKDDNPTGKKTTKISNKFFNSKQITNIMQAGQEKIYDNLSLIGAIPKLGKDTKGIEKAAERRAKRRKEEDKLSEKEKRELEEQEQFGD